MQTGALTQYFDVAQISLWAFWIFFAGLIFHIRREDKREGFPLVSDLPGRVGLEEGALMPAPKVFLLQNGTTVLAPRAEAPEAEPKAVPVAPFPGAPLDPTGDPMIDGVGPASWAMRSDMPDVLWETGEPRIVPLRVAPDFHVVKEDVSPVGMQVIGCDDLVAGTVVDVWVDRSETVARFLEVELSTTVGLRHVLLPTTMAVIRSKAKQVKVRSITSGQFANVPALRNPDQISRREEDRIYGYYAGGTLYAKSSRTEPLL
jgi:photosynthetic reaction center H subunit